MSDTVADNRTAFPAADDRTALPSAEDLTALPAADDMVQSRSGDNRAGHLSGTVCADVTGAGMPANRHLPTRPAWTCVVDGKPWPCPGARIHLRSQFMDDRVGLAVYMSTQLMTAAVDITNGDALPPDLFNRFMAWT